MSKFIELASATARYSDAHHKHGTVLLCKNMIFTGFNHMIDAKYSITIHSEEHAINNFIQWCRVRRYSDNFIRRKLNRSEIITIRITNNNIKYSKPCNMCIELIKKYGIKKVLYIDTDNEPCMVTKKTCDLQTLFMSSGCRSKIRGDC